MSNCDITKIIPTPGTVLAEAIIGEYETESGLLVIKDLKVKNPKIDSVRVIAIGGKFYNRKGKELRYFAEPGDIAYVRRAPFKSRIKQNGKTYCFIDNIHIVASIKEVKANR